MFRNTIFAASAAGLLMSTAALAQGAEFAAGTDLNLRAGPGPSFDIVSVIPASATVTVDGCLADANWCQVTHDGKTGWAASDYLAVKSGDEVAVLATRPATVEVATVTYDNQAEQDAAATAGAATGAAAGALIAGPIGAVFGTVLGAAAGGNAVEPTEEVVTYVVKNPVEPVILDGEVVLGAGIPDTVTLTPVPETEFSYVYVNGLPVVVNNADRTIVKVIR